MRSADARRQPLPDVAGAVDASVALEAEAAEKAWERGATNASDWNAADPSTTHNASVTLAVGVICTDAWEWFERGDEV